MEPMTSLSEITNKLQAEGYTADLNLKEDHLECSGSLLQLHPDDFVVDKHYRFEGPSDPADEAIVYAISSAKYQIKGLLINGYGASSDQLTDDMVHALKETRHT
jgi:hypothetical protein